MTADPKYDAVFRRVKAEKYGAEGWTDERPVQVLDRITNSHEFIGWTGKTMWTISNPPPMSFKMGRAADTHHNLRVSSAGTPLILLKPIATAPQSVSP